METYNQTSPLLLDTACRSSERFGLPHTTHRPSGAQTQRHTTTHNTTKHSTTQPQHSTVQHKHENNDKKHCCGVTASSSDISTHPLGDTQNKNNTTRQNKYQQSPSPPLPSPPLLPRQVAPITLDLIGHALAHVALQLVGGDSGTGNRAAGQTVGVGDAVRVLLSQRPRVVYRLLEVVETFRDHRVLGDHL